MCAGTNSLVDEVRKGSFTGSCGTNPSLTIQHSSNNTSRLVSSNNTSRVPSSDEDRVTPELVRPHRDSQTPAAAPAKVAERKRKRPAASLHKQPPLAPPTKHRHTTSLGQQLPVAKEKVVMSPWQYQYFFVIYSILVNQYCYDHRAFLLVCSGTQ